MSCYVVLSQILRVQNSNGNSHHFYKYMQNEWRKESILEKLCIWKQRPVRNHFKGLIGYVNFFLLFVSNMKLVTLLIKKKKEKRRDIVKQLLGVSLFREDGEIFQRASPWKGSYSVGGRKWKNVKILTERISLLITEILYLLKIFLPRVNMAFLNT